MTSRETIEQIQKKFPGRVRDIVEKSAKRAYITIDPSDLRPVVGFLFNDLKMRFNIASAVDEPAAFEILYHFSKDEDGFVISVRVFINDRENPRIDSIFPLMSGAEWIEREIYELFGIQFTGHENMKPLLLPEDWPAGVYPLRKDFVPPQRDDRKDS